MAAVFASTALVAVRPPDLHAQQKDPKPGYMVIRVLLDSGAADAPAPTTPGQPAAPQQPRRIDPTHSIAAVVPYESIEKRLFSSTRSPSATNPYMPAMKTKYGHTFIYGDKTFIQFFPVRVSLEKTLHDKYEKWSTKRTYDDIHEICNFALMLGDVDDAVKYCDEYQRCRHSRTSRSPPSLSGSSPPTKA